MKNNSNYIVLFILVISVFILIGVISINKYNSTLNENIGAGSLEKTNISNGSKLFNKNIVSFDKVIIVDSTITESKNEISTTNNFIEGEDNITNENSTALLKTNEIRDIYLSKRNSRYKHIAMKRKDSKNTSKYNGYRKILDIDNKSADKIIGIR